MSRRAPALWSARGPRALALLPLAGLFSLVASLRRQLYRSGLLRSERLPVPVVVVGNIAVGGSGKTPIVAWLAEQLRARGWHPGIVSRGYGARVEGVALVGPDDDAARFGDEPVLLARLTACPLAIGADRPAAARHLLAAHPDCDILISDDGLQHYRLARDVEVAVVDEAVLGNAWPLPAGPLREGRRRLREVDLVLFHGPASPALVAAAGRVPAWRFDLRGEELVSLADPARRQPLVGFAGQTVHALAGIGRPARFFAQLEAAGLRVQPHPLGDHHRYTPADFAGLADAPKIVTAKDAVKCAAFAPADTWMLPVRADLPAAALAPILEKIEHGCPTA